MASSQYFRRHGRYRYIRWRKRAGSTGRWLALAVLLFVLGQWIGGGSLWDDGRTDIYGDPQAVVQTGSGADSQAIVQTGSGADPQAIAQTGSGAGPQAVVQTGSGADPQAVVQTGSGADPQAGTPSETELWVDVLDCGQADTTLIRQGTHAMLFDCGAGIPMQIRQYLADAGVERLEMVWLSHPDADHIGAFPSVSYGFPVGRVFVNGETKDTESWSSVQEAIRYGNIPEQIPSPGETYSLGDAQITVLGPLRYYEDNPNNNSLAVKITFGRHSFLFCGDAQAEEEMDLVSGSMPVRCDVLHVNHHGSSDASCMDFLLKAHPAWAVISCGQGNDYGHPHDSTLRRLRQAGAQILRTDESGTVRFRSDGETLRIQTER